MRVAAPPLIDNVKSLASNAPELALLLKEASFNITVIELLLYAMVVLEIAGPVTSSEIKSNVLIYPSVPLPA